MNLNEIEPNSHHPIWLAFEDAAYSKGIDLSHEDDWMAWWEIFILGAIAYQDWRQQEIVGD